MRSAQKIVKGPSYTDLLYMAGPEFVTEGYLAQIVELAGWERGKIRTLEASALVKGEDLKGMLEFMCGPPGGMAQKGWSEEEKGRWPDAVREAIKLDAEEHGGVRVEGWVVLAKKWDELSG